MSKVNYTNLKLKTNTDKTIVDFNGNQIEVLKYLPIQDKCDLVNITLQDSLENGIYNPLKLDMCFHMNLIYLYTNLSFTDKQREDESKLYDTLVSNGLMEEILKAIPNEEYEMLYQYILDAKEENIRYKSTIGGAIMEIFNQIPDRAAEIGDIINNFDKDKFQEVVNFAKAANGNREV